MATKLIGVFKPNDNGACLLGYNIFDCLPKNNYLVKSKGNTYDRRIL